MWNMLCILSEHPLNLEMAWLWSDRATDTPLCLTIRSLTACSGLTLCLTLCLASGMPLS